MTEFRVAFFQELKGNLGYGSVDELKRGVTGSGRD